MTYPRIKTAALFLSIATLQAAVFTLMPLSAARADDGASLTLSFSGIDTSAGAIMAGVYDTESAFTGGEPVQGVRIEISGADATVTVTGLTPGRYAIKAYHDVNGDGQLNTNPFGLPTEPYAASNNAPFNMGPPAWADAVFEVAAGENSQSITID
ncbi:MAG: DUF2141 domain-containing protein [Caulobacter sp.]|nr:DUF2141 domain-containing protein [Caulobacter sp.]